MILVDTSALGKLLVDEAESGALREDLRSRSDAGEEFAISSIAVTELRRLAIRLDVEPAATDPVLAPFRVIRLTEGILQLAGRIPTRHLGTLDAIHIATALTIEATGILTYDARQSAAARAEALEVLTPAP
jgi:uncharacterized protein